MKKIIFINLMFLLSSNTWANDVKLHFESNPTFEEKKICLEIRDLDDGVISGNLLYTIYKKPRVEKSVPVVVNGGPEQTVCQQFTDEEVPNELTFVISVKFIDENGVEHDSDNRMVSTSSTKQVQKKVSVVKPEKVKEQKQEPTIDIELKKNIDIAINRIYNMESCRTQETCLMKQFNAYSVSCLQDKSDKIKSFIREKIPQAEQVISTLSFQCSGYYSPCSRTEYMSSQCLWDNLGVTIRELKTLFKK